MSAKEWLWVNATTAAELAANSDPAMEMLRNGHGYLEQKQFVSLLAAGELRVIAFRNRTAALVTCGKCVEGVALNILTVTGDIDRCEKAIPLLELAAKEINANLIVSVGHPGWEKIMKRQGYQTEKRLLMRKVLNDQRAESNGSHGPSAGLA